MTARPTAHPFDDFRALLPLMPSFSVKAAEAARAREAQLTKPAGALGRMEELAAWLAGWQDKDGEGKNKPVIDRPTVAIFAANHGVAARGVSAYPPAVTRQMVANFGAGGAAINQICGAYGLGLKVFELALEIPTRDFTQQAAMEEAECAATIAFGMEAITGADVLALGEMGIGNTTSAAAIYHALYGGEAADWVGRGAGANDAAMKLKIEAVAQARMLHLNALDDPLEILRCMGGREIAALAGAILAARMERVPVVLDGYVACAAAAVLHRLEPSLLDHCLAGHVSAETPHRAVLKKIDKEPLLDLGMRLGEGSGAALALGLLQAAVACHNKMATFASAGVSVQAGEHETGSA